MRFGKYIVLAFVAFFIVAVALGGEEGFAIWLSVSIQVGIGYSIVHVLYTRRKAKILVTVESSIESAEKKADVSVLVDSAVFKKGVTNNGGRCTFYLPLSDRRYQFKAKAKSGSYESLGEFLDVNDRSMRGVSLKLSSRSVAVKVTNEHNAPVRDASIKAQGSTYTESEHTGGNGRCTFKNIPLESGDLIVEKDGYAIAKILLGENDTLAHVKLEPKFVNVRIVVVDPSEQPLAGASVRIGKSKKSVVTDERGVVEAETRAGTQEISIEKDGFLPFNTTSTISEDGEQRVTLKEPRGKLELRIVDAVSREPLPATVTLSLFNMTSVEGTQKEGGKVLFGDLPVGTHKLRSTAEGHYKKEMSVEITEGVNDMELPLEPLPALSEALLNELVSVEEGLGVSVNNLSQRFDAVLPRYFQSYCLTLLQLARRLPQGANLPPELMVDLIKVVCRDVIGIMEGKKLFVSTIAAEEGTAEFPRRVDEFYEAFKDLITDPHSFYERLHGRVQERITEVDRKITEKMREYEISPVTSLWKLAKKLVDTRGDVEKNAISLFFADIALDFTERMFVVKEVAERLRLR